MHLVEHLSALESEGLPAGGTLGPQMTKCRAVDRATPPPQELTLFSDRTRSGPLLLGASEVTVLFVTRVGLW